MSIINKMPYKKRKKINKKKYCPGDYGLDCPEKFFTRHCPKKIKVCWYESVLKIIKKL